MKRLTAKRLRIGFKFSLENGLPATAYSLNSIRITAKINRLIPKRKFWPLLHDDTLNFLVVEATVDGETIQLVYHGSTKDALRTTIQELRKNLANELRHAAYILYRGGVYMWFDHDAQYLLGAVKHGVPPRIAALVLETPKTRNISERS